MVYLESGVAAAFTLGSAGCLLNLLVLPEGQQHSAPQLVFVTCLLVICVLSTFALWSVEGRHACWHHACPGGGGTDGKEVVVVTEAAQQAPRSCADDAAQHADADSNDLSCEDFPLERRSSFVVSSRVCSVSHAVQAVRGSISRLCDFAFVSKGKGCARCPPTKQVEVRRVIHGWGVTNGNQPRNGFAKLGILKASNRISCRLHATCKASCTPHSMGFAAQDFVYPMM